MPWCYYDGVEKDMPWQTPAWSGFAHGPKTRFWGGGTPRTQGAWCDAEPGQHTGVRCKCYDGQDSTRLCEAVAPATTEATFCLNQCSGRGACLSGYCRCEPGSYGADCSLPPRPRPRPAGGAGGAGDAAADSRGGLVETAAPLRPLIYVYELPGESNTFLLARRQNADACVLREYSPTAGGGSAPKWSPTLYGAEVALHEALLASRHRTLDPEAADFFFVPSYGGCFISEFNKPYPRHWLCDNCHKGQPADLASVRSLQWHEKILEHVRTAHPYWNRSGGADHLWPFTHDEGACYAPQALRRATLLVHWGRTHRHPNGSSEYHLWRVKPWGRRMYGWERCYDACKDLVLPSWRRPEDLASSPYLHPELDTGRPNLFYFNGNLGRTTQLQNYSFGLRQQLVDLYPASRYERQGFIVTDQRTQRYGALLSSAKFCGVLPGWGWSGRMEDAVLHGCIPVILQDGVHTPWETVLDWQAYSLRVPRHEMGGLLERLQAISPSRLAEMQAALRRVWPRFAYLRLVVAEQTRRGKGGGGGGPPVAKLRPLAERDAVATLLEALRVRLLRREARLGQRGGGEAAPGCALTPSRGEVAIDDGVPAPDFEGRTVNGWVI